MREIIRHGEALLLPLDANIDATFESVSEMVVAHSETGHHHVAVGTVERATQFDLSAIRQHLSEVLYGAESVEVDNVFRVHGTARLEHRKAFDKHRDLILDEGVWVTITQQEYDPFAKLIEKVRD